ncbi:MAG: T9SS type A sorting domain-containing protein [Ignavibacteria bacterium]|nr:T9SS type A sorting domain-containing protein [Ignavibacteria bacterium]
MIKLIMELICLKGKIEMAHNSLNYRPAIIIRSIIILIFFTTLNFSFFTFNSYSQWYAQMLPVNPEMIYCVKFWNKNNGWMSTGNSTTAYSPQILKTTNEGNNWSVIRNNMRIYNFQILDSITIYGYGRMNGYNMIYRTFDGGSSWDSVSYSNGYTYTGIYFFDKDTGCIGASDGNWGYILRTSNGGTTLNQIYKAISHSTFGEQLTFFKEKVNGEYYGYCIAGNAYMFKTTNSGYNWTQITGGLFSHPGGYFFLNKDTGWVSNHDNFSHYYIQFTSNSGNSWINQFTSLFNNYYPGGIYFSSFNTGWSGASDGYLVYATTNGGQMWGRQITPNYRTVSLFFLDSLTGWNYGGSQSTPYISKTTNGGGVIIRITKDSSIIIPKNYILKQNYPNPFNNNTIIEYSITKKATIGINIYDVSGISVYDLTANNLDPGNYKLRLDFGALNLTSGIYFYKFIAINQNGVQMFSETKKLMYVK